MMQIRLLALAVLFSLSFSLSMEAATIKNNRLLVKFKEGGLQYTELLSLLGRTQTNQVKTFRTLPLLVSLRLSPSISAQSAVNMLLSDPSVEYAEPIHKIKLFSAQHQHLDEWLPILLGPREPVSILDAQEDVIQGENPPIKDPLPLPKDPVADPQLSLSWGLRITKTLSAWKTTMGDPQIIVAITDTGVDYNHEDLSSNIWRNAGEIAGNGMDDDQNGFIDDVVGWDTVDNDDLPFDGFGHGTHVAGIIGALAQNGKGSAGVAPRVSLMVVKMIGDGGEGTTEDAIEAIDYATAQGANIINMSWGDGEDSRALYDILAAAEKKGVVLVAAAGNSATDNDTSPMYPAAYDLENLIAVAATAPSDTLAFFSNYGKISVDLGAPGFRVYATLPNNRYGYLDGTSMASPHVAGAAALLLAAHPEWTAADVKSQLMKKADAIEDFAQLLASGGRMNVLAAME